MTAKPHADKKPMKFIENFAVEKLKPFPGNPRVHPDSEIAILTKNIEHFGWTNPVLVQAGTHNVIAGHGRIKAAEKAGRTRVPILLWDVSNEDALAHMVADNHIASLSDWELPSLKDILIELDTGGFDLSLTGFTEDDLAALVDRGCLDVDTNREPDSHEKAGSASHTCPNCGFEWGGKEAGEPKT